jgi:hypothetical protein
MVTLVSFCAERELCIKIDRDEQEQGKKGNASMKITRVLSNEVSMTVSLWMKDISIANA